MANTTHQITWDQLVAFAKAIGRDNTHVFRVVKGERQSPPIAQAFEQYFGFPMKNATLAGRKPLRSVA